MNNTVTHSALFSSHIVVALTIIVIWVMYMVLLAEQKYSFGTFLAYVFLALVLLLSSLTLVLCHSIVVAYVAIELASLVSIIMIAFGVSNKSQAYMLEGVVKYVCVTFFGTLFMLYGVYGTLSSGSHFNALETELFIAMGFSIKLGVVPFHGWVTSFNEANEWHNLMLVGTLPKMGIMSFMAMNYTGNVSLFYLTVGCASLSVGSVLMLNAVNFKSFNAYSAIANYGMIMVIMSCMTSHVYGTMPVWLTLMLLTYNFTFATVALVCSFCESRLGLSNIWASASLKHMKFNSYESLVLTTCLLSLSSMPPMWVWYAKVVGITCLATAGHWPLVIFILGFSIVSGYSYLRLVAFLWGGYKGRNPLVRVKLVRIVRFKVKVSLRHANAWSMQYPVIGVSCLVALNVMIITLLMLAHNPEMSPEAFTACAEQANLSVS